MLKGRKEGVVMRNALLLSTWSSSWLTSQGNIYNNNDDDDVMIGLSRVLSKQGSFRKRKRGKKAGRKELCTIIFFIFQ